MAQAAQKKFKVGDTVRRIRFANRYADGRILAVGTICKVCWVGEQYIDVMVNGKKYEDNLLEYFELVKSTTVDKIVITHDGKTTTASLYKNNKLVESEIAKCNPEDEFDFNVGAKLALDRLVKKTTKPKYFTGKVVCIDSGTIPGDVTTGKIYNFVNGLGKNNYGGELVGRPVKDCEDLNSRFMTVRFIPIVE